MGTLLEDFEAMVAKHDLTYDFSDDGAVWRAGRASECRIREAAKKLPAEDVKRIWNAMVDKTLVESSRTTFYWKD